MIKKHWKKILIIMLIVIVSASIGAVYADYILNATEVTYNKKGNTIAVNTALDELYAKATTPVKVPTVGDVVNYNANRSDAAGNTYATGTYTYTTNTSDTSANDYTGGTTSSTYSSADEMVWKILDINNYTGAITLMAANETPSSLELGRMAGYAYCENILNNISEVYGHGYGASSAKSITAEDINKITGYNPVGTRYRCSNASLRGGKQFFAVNVH